MKVTYKVFYLVYGINTDTGKKIEIDSHESFTSDKEVEGQALYSGLVRSIKHKYKFVLDASVKISEIHTIRNDG